MLFALLARYGLVHDYLKQLMCYNHEFCFMEIISLNFYILTFLSVLTKYQMNGPVRLTQKVEH